MSFGQLIAEHIRGQAVALLQTALTTGELDAVLTSPVYQSDKLAALHKLYEPASQSVAIEIAQAKALEDQGVRPNDKSEQAAKHLASLHAAITFALLGGNRPPVGSQRFLRPQDYWALTPHSPRLKAQQGDELLWGQAQILMHSPDELAELAQEGNRLLQGNTICPGLSTVAMGFPIAGTASRALKFATQHPEIAAKIKALGALDGLDVDDLPPRYLYPVATSHGPKTLIGLMMNNFLATGSKLGLASMTIAMLSSQSGGLALDRLRKDLGSLNVGQLRSMLAFIQPVSPRLYISDAQPTDELFPTGHGDFPNLMAQNRLFALMQRLGIKCFQFGNGDEFLYGGDPTLVAVTQQLLDRGYDGVVFVVPNCNNQLGGGAVEDLDAKGRVVGHAHLEEGPCLAGNLVANKVNPPILNTTFYNFKVSSLAAVSQELQTLHPALDVKAIKGRNGGVEQVVCLETWAGTEFTRRLKVAFVVAPRAGFFLGIKSLEHTHSHFLPPELAGHKVQAVRSWSYERLVRHLADTYPQVIARLRDKDRQVCQAVFDAGYSYLIEPELLR